MRQIFALMALLCCSLAGAQTMLPPVWGQQAKTDRLTRAYITPKRIVWMQGDLKSTELLLREGNGQPDLAGVPACLMKNGDSVTASIILDYGRELHGGLKLVAGHANAASAKVRIRFGESVAECCADADGGQNRKGFATNDHATRDAEYLLPRYGQMEIGSSGFRFVRIDLLEPGRSISLKEATAILRYRDVPYVGSFRCSDPRLDSIWMTGAYTVHMCMQEYLWDGIKRDRCIWLGDMHPEVNTIMRVFGQNEVVTRSLDVAAEEFPLPRWFNGMSSYSLWYLIIQHDWFMHGGDRDFLMRHHDYITGLVDKIAALVDKNGTEHLEEGNNGDMARFLDWPSTPNKKGMEAGYRALISWAMTDAGALCRWMGDEERAAKCSETVKRLARKVLPDNGLQQARALKMIAGLQKPTADFEVEGFSTFYGYYMLEALAKGGHWQKALDLMRQYWGAMLDLGATTFWEDFNIDWMRNAARIDEMVPEGKVDVHREYGDYCYLSYRHSLCHGWASGPTAWLSQHVLGVEVLEPGCRKLRITPHLADLQWAEGAFPTPLGPVTIRHEKSSSGEVVTTVDAPEGITIVK